MVTSDGRIPGAITQGFPDFKGQQLGTGGSLKLAGELNLEACECPGSGEEPTKKCEHIHICAYTHQFLGGGA